VIEGFYSPTLAQVENVGVTFGGQESGFGGIAGNDGVDGVGGAVDKNIRLPQKRVKAVTVVLRRFCQCIKHTFDWIRWRCGRLEHLQFAVAMFNDQIGKGTASICC